MSIGDKASINSAIIMAGVGHDVMTDPDLRSEVRTDFDRRKGGANLCLAAVGGSVAARGISPHLLLRDGTGKMIDELYNPEYV